MDRNLQGTGIVSRPQISPELYWRKIKKKKKMKVYLAGCLAISSETALASQNGWLPFNNLVRDKKERALGLPIPCQFCLNRVASRGLSCPGGLKSS